MLQPAKTEIAHVLFVDIVGWSKGSLEAQSDSIDMLSEALEASDAYREDDEARVVASGDGMAVLFFRDLTSPIRCALELAGSLDVPVRMGIHSGPVRKQLDVGRRENFVGEGINVAKRVLDVASPGEILLSGTYGDWIRLSDQWTALIAERDSAIVKHGVELRLFRVKEEPKKLASKGAKKVVLLYKRNAQPDQEILGVLSAYLLSQGHKVLVDRHERLGLDWVNSIEQSIREADLAVLVLSDAALKSEMTRAQVEIAQDARRNTGRPVLLPIRVGSSSAIDGPLGKALTGIRCETWLSQADSERIFGTIRRALRENRR